MARSSAAKAAHLAAALIRHGSLVDDLVQHEDPALADQALHLLGGIDQHVQSDFGPDQSQHLFDPLQQGLVGPLDHDEVEVAPLVEFTLSGRAEEDQLLGLILPDENFDHSVEFLLKTQSSLFDDRVHSLTTL